MQGMAVRRTMWVERTRTLAFIVLALLVAGLIGLVLGAKPAHAKTFTVNSTGDTGDSLHGNGSCFTGNSQSGPECTLRAAIEEANKLRGADTIEFRVGSFGTGLQTISLNTDLPPITKRVTINGYTQGDATENNLIQPGQTNASPKIVLDRASVGGVAPGLSLIGSGASNSVIRGLVINGFDYGIVLANSTGHRIEGNFIGTNAEGTAGDGNGYGVFLSNADGSTIGGATPGARNLISGNSSSGVALFAGSSGNKIQGNLIGTDKSGTANLGNRDYGVLITAAGSSSPSNGNTIGDSDPTDGSLTNAANTIAFNGSDGGFDGVGLGAGSTGNRILGNSIFSNAGVGIDLGSDGVTANDDRDPDTGPNRLQNFPLITTAQEAFGNTTLIGGDLNSTPSTRKKKRTFIIQFFVNPSTDPDEGKTFLGQIEVKTDRQGNALDFGLEVSQNDAPEGDFITATATNKATGDTSEFSEAARVEGQVIGGG